VVGVPLTAPSINATTIEDRLIGAYESWTIKLSGGTPPHSGSVVSGSLPPGMSLQAPVDLPPLWSSSGILLAGTSTAPGTYTFTLRAADNSSPGAQTTARTFTVRVSALSWDGLPDRTRGVPYNQKIRVLGGTPPYAYSIVEGRFPAGLTMDSSGQVTGTPTESWESS